MVNTFMAIMAANVVTVSVMNTMSRPRMCMACQVERGRPSSKERACRANDRYDGRAHRVDPLWQGTRFYGTATNRLRISNGECLLGQRGHEPQGQRQHQCRLLRMPMQSPQR